MLNPDPDKFYTLPNVFNALGREHYHDTWTGAEIAARKLPLPKATFQVLKEAKQGLDRERCAKVERAKKAATVVWSGARTSHRSYYSRRAPPEAIERQRIQEIARYAGLEPETVTAASNKRTYRREHKARARRDKTENDLRRLLYDKPIPATLLNNHDGKLVDIDHTLWLAEKFTVDFTSGQAEWTDLEKGQQIAYQGFVLVDRQKFDRDVRKPKQLTSRAVTLCIEWARGLPPDPVWRKPDFTKKAMDDFDGLSQKSAWKVWAEEVPDKWKKGGRKPRASLN